jgi:hypothetical protein
MQSKFRQLTCSFSTNCHLWVCAYVIAFCSSGSFAHAEDDVFTLLEKARQSESLVKTGRIKFDMVRNVTPPTADEIRKMYSPEVTKDPKFDQVIKEIRSMDRSAWSEDFIFDNTRNALALQTVDSRTPAEMLISGKSTKSNVDKTVTIFKVVQINKVTHAKKDPHYDVRVQKTPLWPPHWPYDMLMSSVWLRLVADSKATPANIKLIDNDKRSGQIILMDSSGPQSVYNQKIWIDTKNGYTLTRMEGYDKKTGRLVQERTCSYKVYQGKYWYPDHLTETSYRYKADGARYINSRGTLQVQTADLNVDIPEKELGFDDIPFGAVVHDERFDPTLDYRQGDTQYTDEELFKARNDKSKLRDMQSIPSKPQTRPAVTSIPIIIGGLSVFTLSIVMARRSRQSLSSR